MTTEYLLEREMKHVFSALMPSNATVCKVMLQTGLRVGDVLNLRTEQLKRQFWINEQKTGKRRRVNLTDALIREIKAGAVGYWAFPSPKNSAKHRTRQAVWWDVKRAAKAFRLPQNVADHSLRKVYAVELLKKYGDIDRVKKALNHDRQAVTIIYACADKLLESKLRARRLAVK